MMNIGLVVLAAGWFKENVEKKTEKLRKLQWVWVSATTPHFIRFQPKWYGWVLWRTQLTLTILVSIGVSVPEPQGSAILDFPFESHIAYNTALHYCAGCDIIWIYFSMLLTFRKRYISVYKRRSKYV
jgi:hypothetical protein